MAGVWPVTSRKPPPVKNTTPVVGAGPVLPVDLEAQRSAVEAQRTFEVDGAQDDAAGEHFHETPSVGSMAMAVRRRVVADGRVQGAFFRDSAQRMASSVGVAGWCGTATTVPSRPRSRATPTPSTAWSPGCAKAPAGPTSSAVEVYEEKPQGESGFRFSG